MNTNFKAQIVWMLKRANNLNRHFIKFKLKIHKMWPDLQERVLYPHHFRTQISPPFYGYIIRQSMCACFVAISSPVCFSWGCFLRHVRHPWMPGLYSVISAGLFNKGYQLWGVTRSYSDIIYWFNYFLCHFKHQWIHKTSVTTQHVLSHHFVASHHSWPTTPM